MHGVSALLVFVFGAATLALRDERFIQWKPTVFFWLVAVAFLGSLWIGERPLVQRLLGPALGDARVPRATWLNLNLQWVVFYTVLGGLNLYVAFNASERTWVNFKVFGITLATLVFVSAQLLWLSRQPDPAARDGAAS
jgi:intracellular septation protein